MLTIEVKERKMMSSVLLLFCLGPLIKLRNEAMKPYSITNELFL